MNNKNTINTRELVRDALLAALLLVIQISLAWIPNVELVSLLLILYTLVYRKHVWIILYVFVVLEGFFYGFGLWWFSYLYVWAILVGFTFLMSKYTVPGPYGTALLSGIFGLLFGLLCAASYFVTGGLGAAIAWWIAGIPFDVVHGISNFIITLVLFKPLHRMLMTLKRMEDSYGDSSL